MKICLVTLHFGNLTGSETYLFTLAKALKKRGHDVTIAALNREGLMLAEAQAADIPVELLDEVHGSFDLYQIQQTPAAEAILKRDTTTPKVMVIHSEVVPGYETPVLHPSIKHYVAIRPSIVRQLEEQGIAKNQISLIYNGIDEERFKPTPLPKGSPVILFASTNDYLREKAALDILSEIKIRNARIIFCGHGWEGGTHLKHPSVLFLPATPQIENLIAQATEVAGIMLGRWELEGWMMGRPSIEYIVGDTGEILKKTKRAVPKDMRKYTASFMTDCLEEVYAKIV